MIKINTISTHQQPGFTDFPIDYPKMGVLC